MSSLQPLPPTFAATVAALHSVDWQGVGLGSFGRPQNYVAHFNLGRAYLGKGDVEQARQEFDKAVQLRPDYTIARLAQTQVALLRGDTEAAIHDADDLLQPVWIGPSWPVSLRPQQ